MARSTKDVAAKTAKETAQEASQENLEKESQDQGKESQEDQAPESDTKAATDSAPRFTKEQLLKSNWYSHRRDLLGALLKDGETYSHAGVANLISEFMKGKVR